MKIPKVRSYIRLVTVFFLLFAVFVLFQSMVIHFRVTSKIMPSYFQDKQDLTGFIKSYILQEAKTNPHFNIYQYIKEQNKKLSRFKLDFIPENRFQADQNPHSQIRSIYRDSLRKRFRILEAVPLEVKGESGYLILTSQRLNTLNNRLNMLFNFTVISLFLAMVIGFLIFRLVYRKSEKLVEVVEKISQGDYSARVAVHGVDEFSVIGQSINQMAASIEKATLELKEMDLQRRNFIADISHELSTPLTAIKGYIETLQMEDFKLSPAEERQYLQIIGEETERLSFLVKDLLEMARVDAGTITIEKEMIKADGFFTAFAARNALRLTKAEVRLECVVEPGLLIYADYRRLEQILQNLLDNALKHSKGLTRISLHCTRDQEQIKILIHNDGAGIPNAHLSRIFDRYYQVGTPEKNQSIDSHTATSGLGLAIVKGLVELHQGVIEVLSEAGSGTTFVITLPDIQRKENIN